MSVWKGFKEFIVSDKVAENEYIYSFYLTSTDDEKLPDYLPGQFIAIRVQNEDRTWSRPRQYTLSSVSNGKYFKISVKREPEGDVSKKLCDTVHKGDLVKISAPTGKFVLKDDGTNSLNGKTGTSLIDVLFFIPENKFTRCESYKNDVKRLIKQFGKLRYTGVETGIVVDDQKKALTFSILYESYKRLI